MRVPVYDIVNCGPRHQFTANGKIVKNSSIGLQVHNFRRDAFDVDEVPHYRGQILRGDRLSDPKTNAPVPVIDTLGKMLRAAIIPEPGSVFVVGDWTSVESMMTAYLAREKTKLDVFRRGECPYCYCAEGVYNRPITKEKDPEERQVGKVVDLACGFLGGPGALAAMASSYSLYIEEERRKAIVDAWRGRHPRTVAYGNLLVAQAMAAIKSPRKWKTADRVAYIFDGTHLYCRLPDGLTMLRYPYARIEMVPAPWDKNKKIPQITALKAAFTMGEDDDEWPRHNIWRGTFLENIVQSSCAILLRGLIRKFEKDCIFHVHDENILEVPASLAESVKLKLKEEMETAPAWCAGLPLSADPVLMPWYGK